MSLLSPRSSPGPELFLQQQGAVKVTGTVLPPSVTSNSHNSLSRLKIQFESSLNLLAQVRGNQFVVVCGLCGILKGRLLHQGPLRSTQGVGWIVLAMLMVAPQFYIFPPLQISASFSPWVHRFWKKNHTALLDTDALTQCVTWNSGTAGWNLIKHTDVTERCVTQASPPLVSGSDHQTWKAGPTLLRVV